MRQIIKLIILIAIAIGLAVALQDQSGYVSITYNNTRYTTSLITAVIALVFLCLIVYVVLRLISKLIHIPSNYRRWRNDKQTGRDMGLLEQGWVGMLEGRTDLVEKDLKKLSGKTSNAQRQIIASLATAKAAHLQGNDFKRDEMLAVTLEKAVHYPKLYDAAVAVKSEILLDQGRGVDALLLLEKLDHDVPNQTHVKKLLLRAYKQTGRAKEVIKTVRFLIKKKAMDVTEGESLIEQTAATMIRQAQNETAWQSFYKDLTSKEQILPLVALAMAQRYHQVDQDKEASKLLEKSYEATGDSRLLDLYVVQCPPAMFQNRLQKIQKWLKDQPNQPDLLRAAGHLCMLEQLWGQAERYLKQSVHYKNDSRTNALLGALYDQLGRTSEALKYWRVASSEAIALPSVMAENHLPSAEVQNDPKGPPDIKNLDGADVSFWEEHADQPKVISNQEQMSTMDTETDAAIAKEEVFDASVPVHPEQDSTNQHK